MTVTRQYLASQIVTATDNSDGEYDVDGIVQAIIDQYGYVNADSIDADAFWSLVLEHLVPAGIPLADVAREMSGLYGIEFGEAEAAVTIRAELIYDYPALHAFDIDGGHGLTEDGATLIRTQMAGVYAEVATPTGVTREQAEQALEAVKGQWSYDVAEGNVPKLVENWDWLESGTTPWAIVWEEGPDEWAMRAQNGGTDEEATALARDDSAITEILGEQFTVATPAAVAWPEGVFAEPITPWAVGLYLI